MNNSLKCTFKKRTGSISDRVQFAQQTQNTLMANSQYAAIVPSTAEVAGIISTVLTYQAECAAHNFVHKPQRDQALLQLDNALSNQCRWINGMANGNLDFLTDCGFPLSKTPEQKPQPERSKVDRVESLPAGEAMVYGTHSPVAEWYQTKITGPANFEKWQTSKYPKFKVADLITGVTLNAYVRAVNYRGPGEWSQPLSFVAQVSPFSSTPPAEEGQ